MEVNMRREQKIRCREEKMKFKQEWMKKTKEEKMQMR